LTIKVVANAVVIHGYTHSHTLAAGCLDRSTSQLTVVYTFVVQTRHRTRQNQSVSGPRCWKSPVYSAWA